MVVAMTSVTRDSFEAATSPYQREDARALLPDDRLGS